MMMNLHLAGGSLHLEAECLSLPPITARLLLKPDHTQPCPNQTPRAVLASRCRVLSPHPLRQVCANRRSDLTLPQCTISIPATTSRCQLVGEIRDGDHIQESGIRLLADRDPSTRPTLSIPHEPVGEVQMCVTCIRDSLGKSQRGL